MSIIFSDKYRIIKAITLITLIFSLCIYSRMKEDSSLTFQQCLLNPNKYDKVRLNIGHTDTKIGKVRKDGFELVESKDRISVMGNAKNLKENEYIYLQAIFHKEGYLELERIRIRRFRRLKMAVSVLPVLLVTFLFFKRYRFNFKTLVFVEKQHA